MCFMCKVLVFFQLLRTSLIGFSKTIFFGFSKDFLFQKPDELWHSKKEKFLLWLISFKAVSRSNEILKSSNPEQPSVIRSSSTLCKKKGRSSVVSFLSFISTLVSKERESI